MQTVSGDATIATNTGTHTIAGPVNAASPITKSGPGTLVLSGGYSGTGGLTVSAGKVVISGGGQLASLAVANDGAAIGSRSYSAVVDVNQGSLVIAGGATPATTLANITDMARAGQNAANLFTGNGLTSSAAAADASGALRYAVGVVLNNIDGSPLYSTFGGYTVGPNDVLVKFTYFGDADLNGLVDDSDFYLVNNGYAMGLSGWINGDFDYSGSVDDTDFYLLNNGYANQGAALRGTSNVPEPTTATTALLAGGLLTRRRRS
jgi:autotransporter-associated beta strand protein